MKPFYLPILKAKAGELRALQKLHEKYKSSIAPLLEVTPPEWDFSENKMNKTIDDKCASYVKDYCKNVKGMTSFLDIHLIQKDLGSNPALYENMFLEISKDSKTFPIPTISLGLPASLYSPISKVISTYANKNALLRIRIEEILSNTLKDDLNKLLATLGEANYGLLLDLGAPKNFADPGAFAKLVNMALQKLAAIREFSFVAVAATAFPENMAVIKAPGDTVPRQEWKLFKELNNIYTGKYLLHFGDYGIAHPSYKELDMRIIKPKASIKYTIDDAWHIARGEAVRNENGDGYKQFHAMCAELMKNAFFMGSAYSFGDAFISQCSNSITGKTGNLTSWVEVGNNHHMTKVLNDLLAMNPSASKQ